MILDSLDVSPERFAAGTGWTIEPAGACRGDLCVPLGRPAGFDLVATAGRLGMALVRDEETGTWALGPETLGGRALASAQAPELVLTDLSGEEFRLSSLRGQKVLLVAWAPWQGCAFDLPGWQALRTELAPRGLEVVTVSLEVSGPEVSRPHIDAAAPQHPSLLDPEHRVDRLFGVVNVPSVVWIDEEGLVVRPPEPGWPGGERRTPPGFFESVPRLGRAAGAPQRTGRSVGYDAALASGQSRTTYADAVRDWVARGPDSPHALPPAEVVARSRPRPRSVSEAAAHFELAEHLWRTGARRPAIEHFTACHRLQPENWTYKRQAYSLVAAERSDGAAARFAQGPLVGEEDSWPFASDFRSEVEALAEGEYYPRTLGAAADLP